MDCFLFILFHKSTLLTSGDSKTRFEEASNYFPSMSNLFDHLIVWFRPDKNSRSHLLNGASQLWLCNVSFIRVYVWVKFCWCWLRTDLTSTEQRSGQHLRGLLSGEDHHHHRLHRLRLQSFHHDHVQTGRGKRNAAHSSSSQCPYVVSTHDVNVNKPSLQKKNRHIS